MIYLINLLAERLEVFRPPDACAKVRVCGIYLKLYPTTQTIDHRIQHIVQLDKETILFTDMIHEPTTERLIYLLIAFAFPMFHLIKIYI